MRIVIGSGFARWQVLFYLAQGLWWFCGWINLERGDAEFIPTGPQTLDLQQNKFQEVIIS